MRNAVKITFAFLLGLLLLGTQGVFSASGNASAPPCACTGCKKMCCATREASVPQPVAPAPASSRNHVSLFVATLAQVIALARPAAPEFSTAYSSVAVTAAVVPLYQWNCSYLI